MNNSKIIDFVVPWVDDSDPVWRAKKEKYTDMSFSEGNAEARYRDWDVLKYWFRGVEKFAPWVRYVWFITDDQKPEWLNLEHPKLKWVRHTDFIPEEYLPTFSSHPIEWNLHRIDGLAEQFVYFNDDMFLIRETDPEDFFVDGLPCDSPELETVCPVEFFSYLMFNNAFLLNRHFSMRETLRWHWRKWIQFQSPKGLLKLLWYGRTGTVPGVRSNHIHIPYRKETFQTLWEQEEDWIRDTCSHRQRTKDDITTWCVRDWRCLSGDFYPKASIGKVFSTGKLETNHAIQYLTQQKGKVICLNDSEDEKDFVRHKQMIIAAFEQILPEKSSFEL